MHHPKRYKLTKYGNKERNVSCVTILPLCLQKNNSIQIGTKTLTNTHGFLTAALDTNFIDLPLSQIF